MKTKEPVTPYTDNTKCTLQSNTQNETQTMAIKAQYGTYRYVGERAVNYFSSPLPVEKTQRKNREEECCTAQAEDTETNLTAFPRPHNRLI